MKFEIINIINYSIALAVIIGLVRFPKILRTYRPFLLLLIVSLASEVISNRLVYAGHSNAVVSNVFMLAECMLYLWQFKFWEGFEHRQRLFIVLTSCLFTFWFTEHILFWKIVTFQSEFAIIYSFCLVFLAINQVNRLITRERNNLLRNARFIICIGIIIFFTYKIMVESFYVMKLDRSNTFMSNVYNILVVINLLVNLLFGYAALLLPTREPFRLKVTP